MKTRLLAFVLAVGPGAAQAAPSADETGITKEQADQLLQEMKEIKGLLQQLVKQGQAPRPAAAPERVSLKLGEHQSLGPKDAPVTIVEFTDYQCPFCKRFEDQTFAELKKVWVDTGKVRFVTRDLPLPFHANAQRAAEAARCAGDQERFWQMRETLFANNTNLSAEAIKGYASQVGLDVREWETCLGAERFKAEIAKDIADATAVGITGTPSFVVGKTMRDGVEGLKLVGAQPLAAFETQIKALLPLAK